MPRLSLVAALPGRLTSRYVTHEERRVEWLIDLRCSLATPRCSRFRTVTTSRTFHRPSPSFSSSCSRPASLSTSARLNGVLHTILWYNTTLTIDDNFRLALTPRQVVADLLKVPVSVVEGFAKEKQIIVS